VTATDTSPDALDLARENARLLGLGARVRFERGTIPGEGRFALVLANLPYVSEDELAALPPEVLRHEPREALLGGADGLEAIRLTAPAATAALTEGGALALEVGAGQAGAVAELLLDLGYRQVESRADLAGVPRVVLGLMDPA
jgi:release factor glutamine methyltransferase